MDSKYIIAFDQLCTVHVRLCMCNASFTIRDVTSII